MGPARRAAWVLTAGLWACGQADATDPLPSPADAGPADAAPRDAGHADAEAADAAPPPRPVEIGTGVEAYQPLRAGQTIELIAGPQGGGRYFGFHVWMALRTHVLAPDALSAQFVVSDPTAVAELGSSSYRLDLMPTRDGYAAWGLRVLLMDCCLAENRELELRVAVEDAQGVTAADSVRVRTGECPRGLPNPTIDPCP